MQYFRSVILGIMRDWFGKNVTDGSHKEIIDTYNTISSLPTSHKVKYTDAWCAATVSAAFHKAEYDSIFPVDCDCKRMITKAESMEIWIGNNTYMPNPGDCVIYTCGDAGIDNSADTEYRIGVVEKVDGDTMTVIEGDFAKAVKRRGIAVNAKIIKGFIVPKFDADAPTKKTTKKATTDNKKGE